MDKQNEAQDGNRATHSWQPVSSDSESFVRTAALRTTTKEPPRSHFPLLVSGSEPGPGCVWARMPAFVGPQRAAGFAAAAAPSACATSGRTSETLQRDSTRRLAEPPAPSLWAAEGAVSSKLVQLKPMRKMTALWRRWRRTSG